MNPLDLLEPRATRKLAERVEELEEENRQLLAMIRANDDTVGELQDAFGLSKQQAELLGALLKHAQVSHDVALAAMPVSWRTTERIDMNHTKVIISRLRKKLARHGVKIETIWGWGYKMDDASKGRINALRKPA